MEYYNKCIDIIKNKDPCLLVEIMIDKAKLEQSRYNSETAVDILNNAIIIANIK
jgi:hypothetical protein